jgi:hypothetical protein
MGSGSLRKSSQTNRGRKPKPRVKTRKETQTKKKKKKLQVSRHYDTGQPFFLFYDDCLDCLTSERAPHTAVLLNPLWGSSIRFFWNIYVRWGDMVWYRAFMELKEVDLGPLVTDDLDRAQISGNVSHSAFSIFNNGRHYFEIREDVYIYIHTRGKNRTLRR